MNIIKQLALISIFLGSLILIISFFCLVGNDVQIYRTIAIYIFFTNFIIGITLLEVSSQIDKHSEHLDIIEMQLEQIRNDILYLFEHTKDYKSKGENNE